MTLAQARKFAPSPPVFTEAAGMRRLVERFDLRWRKRPG